MLELVLHRENNRIRAISKSDVHHTNTIKCGIMVIHTYCHPYMKESCLNFAFKSDRSTKMRGIWENSVV